MLGSCYVRMAQGWLCTDAGGVGTFMLGIEGEVR